MEQQKKTKQKAAYPLADGKWIKAQFIMLYLLLPALLLCLGLLAVFGLVYDVQVGKLDDAGSIALLVISAAVCLSSAACLLFYTHRYGTFKGYYYAACSKRFKRETARMLAEAGSLYGSISEVKYNGADKEISRHLRTSMDSLAAYKKYYLANGAAMKLEAVTYAEAAKLRPLLVPEGFSHDSFLVQVKKVHFLVEERFAGTVAKAYRGEENYAFISYSHRDTKEVLNAIAKMQEAKINVWFDEGITEGADWMNHIAEKVDGCAAFVLFQTPSYVKSVNCNVEIKRALKDNKKIIRVILADSKFDPGVEMYLDAIQGIDCRGGLDKKMEKLIAIVAEGLKPKEAARPAQEQKQTEAKKPDEAAKPEEEAKPKLKK